MPTKKELQEICKEEGIEFVTRDTKADLEKKIKEAGATVEEVSFEDATHIDRSNGVLLREKDLDKDKPWISPISGQATVEKLTEEEKESFEV